MSTKYFKFDQDKPKIQIAGVCINGGSFDCCKKTNKQAFESCYIDWHSKASYTLCGFLIWEPCKRF